MSIKRFVLLSCAVVWLGACSAPLVVQDADDIMVEPLYSYGAGGRDLQLVVSGNPFAVPQETFAASVEGDLDGASILQPPPRPRLRPDSSAKANYALVMAFEAPLEMDAGDLCRGGQGVQAPADPVRVLATLCISGRPYRTASGSVQASAPDDPAFRDLIQQVSLAIFRPDSSFHKSGGGDSVNR